MAEEHKGKNKAKWKYKIIDLSISQHPQTLSGSHVNKYKTTPEVVVCPKHIEW